jgi:zinc protease
MTHSSSFPGPEQIKRCQFANGLTLLVYENFTAQSVSLEGFLRAGALSEPAEQAGLAAFTADCLMRGTANRSFEQIYEELESVGASLGISGGRHLSSFSGDGLAEEFDLLLTLLADALRYPIFPTEQVEQVRGEILTGLQIRANDTGQRAGMAFYETLYQDHPYGRSGDGYPETIQQIGRADLVQFHRDHYGPAGMVLTAVGAVKYEDAVEKVTAVLGDWSVPQQRPIPAVPPTQRPLMTLRQHVPMPGKSQSDILLGVPGPSRAADDYLTASLANTILGVFGMMGRLGEAVREERGLAYYAYSALGGGLGPTPWLASAGVAPDKVDEAIESIIAEIQRMMTEPVDAEELADNIAYRTGSLPVSLETNDGLASAITNMALYDLGLDYLQRYPEMIAAITAADIQAVMQKYWHMDQLVVAVAGPGKVGSKT